MTITQEIEKFKRSKKWIVHPAQGMPKLSQDPKAPVASIPDDLLQFYSFCSGMETDIQSDDDLFLSIVAPRNFQWAPRLILGDLLEKQVPSFDGGIEWFWYIVGRGDTDEYFVIDLAPERYGRCHYVYFYFFGQKGGTPVIAHSFTELLKVLYHAAKVGEAWRWERLGLGDAYD